MAKDRFSVNVRLNNGSRQSVEINEYPDKCPVCDEGGVPTEVSGHSLGDAWDYDEVVEIVFQCPKNECKRYYLAHYYKPSRTGDLFFLKNTLSPQYWKPTRFSEEIKSLSPKFPRIYNQSSIAEGFGLDEIAGGGYRKSLEYLIKDYLIETKLKTNDEVEQLGLSTAISNINDERIQACAKRAAWLGNDEIHYYRIWEDKDINNLKELIKLSVNYIESEVITNKYKESMLD